MECCVCNNSVKDEFAPKYWSMCSDCSGKGLNVCKNDRKIYNKLTTDSEAFELDQVFSLIIDNNNDLLSDIYKQYISKYAKKKNNTCCNNCYNIIYINNCIKYLQGLIDGKHMPHSKRVVSQEEQASNVFISLVKNKIEELENIKNEYK